MVRIERVYTSPDSYEPFLLSQGVKVMNLFFVSGQAGYGEERRGGELSRPRDRRGTPRAEGAVPMTRVATTGGTIR